MLVQLRGANLGELAQTSDAGAQLELGRRGQAERLRLLCLCVPGDHAGIDGVGLLQPTHALRELAHGTRVDHRHRQAVSGQLGKGSLFVAAGGFHGDQCNLMGLTEGSQLCDAFRAVGETGCGAVLSDARG